MNLVRARIAAAAAGCGGPDEEGAGAWGAPAPRTTLLYLPAQSPPPSAVDPSLPLVDVDLAAAVSPRPAQARP